MKKAKEGEIHPWKYLYMIVGQLGLDVILMGVAFIADLCISSGAEKKSFDLTIIVGVLMGISTAIIIVISVCMVIAMALKKAANKRNWLT